MADTARLCLCSEGAPTSSDSGRYVHSRAAGERRPLVRPIVGKTLGVRLSGGKLFIIDGDERVELFPESELQFFELVEERNITFLRDSGGAVTHMMLDGNLRARRLPPA